VTLNDVAGSALSGGRARRDADGDGRADAWFSFERRELGLTSGAQSFELRARTVDGVMLVGFDHAQVAGRTAVVGVGLHDVLAGDGVAFSVRAESPARRDGVLHLSLPEARDVTVEVFSVDGRRVAGVGPLAFGAGRHRVGLPGVERLTSGVYWARLRAGADSWSGRIVRVD